MHINVMWFRTDLRVNDNIALYHACKDVSALVSSIFVSTPNQWLLHNQSPKKTFYIYQNILFLKEKLLQLNIPLLCLQATNFSNAIQVILQFCIKNKVKNIYFNYECGFNENKRDTALKKLCFKHNIFVHSFYDNVLILPDKIKNKRNQSYKKYMFFKHKIIKKINFQKITLYPMPQPRKFSAHRLDEFIPTFQYPQEKFNELLFPIGEKRVRRQLKIFCQQYYFQQNIKLVERKTQKNSFLSPALNIGIISIRECLSIFLKKNFSIKTTENIYSDIWLNEIFWREFFYHLMYSYPELSRYKTFSRVENIIPWKKNKFLFRLWKKGKTGFPIIDAAMRQLNKLGWISNRLRMIVGSFLTKNLFLNWRLGERYFMSQLIDGNLAINNGCWQWIASIGTENMPYFRKFNFISQSKKIDLNGKFIKKMIPELQGVPDTHIHLPYSIIKKNTCSIQYPRPIVNLHTSQKRAIKIFSQIHKYIKKIKEH